MISRSYLGNHGKSWFCYVFSGLMCRSVDNQSRKRIAHDRHSKNRTLVAQLPSYTIHTKSARRADLSASWCPSCRSCSLSWSARITSTFRGVWPTKMGLDSLTQKSHTLIVFDEKAVISWVEIVLREGPEGRSVFVFSLFWVLRTTKPIHSKSQASPL